MTSTPAWHSRRYSLSARRKHHPKIDVSPENDGRSKLAYAGGFDGPSHETTGPMKRSKFSEEQVAYALRQAEADTPVGDVCRQLGVSEATFYTWKKKCAHLGVSELRRLRQLEDENARLKRVVADLTLDKHMLAEALRKNA
jgi:putative transposase